jgi:hypothetical protein
MAASFSRQICWTKTGSRLAMIAPRLFSPTQQLRSRAAHPQASEAPPVQLLTTPPEEMPDALGIDAGKSRGIWQALRKGLDPTNDPIVEVPHKDQGMVVNSQHVSVRMQRRLAESCAPLRAGEVATALKSMQSKRRALSRCQGFETSIMVPGARTACTCPRRARK